MFKCGAANGSNVINNSGVPVASNTFNEEDICNMKVFLFKYSAHCLIVTHVQLHNSKMKCLCRFLNNNHRQQHAYR